MVARDRRRWLQWLFEAKKRYGLSVCNYILTSIRRKKVDTNFGSQPLLTAVILTLKMPL